jgi:hypothetical protein
MEIKDLADCDYVLEAATEEVKIKKVILKNLKMLSVQTVSSGSLHREFREPGLHRKRSITGVAL